MYTGYCAVILPVWLKAGKFGRARSHVAASCRSLVSMLGQIWPKSARRCSTSHSVGQIRTKVGRCRPNFGRSVAEPKSEHLPPHVLHGASGSAQHRVSRTCHTEMGRTQWSWFGSIAYRVDWRIWATGHVKALASNKILASVLTQACPLLPGTPRTPK